MTYFRRCHRRHADEDGELYRRAAAELDRLKRTASGREERDVIVWFALGERLESNGFGVDWMTAHVEPRCPECGGRLSYATGPHGPIGRCGGSCRDTHDDRLETIRETVRSLYARTFPDDTAPETDALSLL